jgi:hypothetical protein
LRYKRLSFFFAAAILTTSVASAAGHSRHYAKLNAELNHRAASAPASQNHVMSRGFMLPGANAWNLGVMWGMPKVSGETGDNIVWGT